MKKAGNNYLLEVGKLIGPQMLIEEDEKDRQADIFLSNARTFEYRITLTLPDGYQAKGLEDLNVKLDNRAGQFCRGSTAGRQQTAYYQQKELQEKADGPARMASTGRFSRRSVSLFSKENYS